MKKLFIIIIVAGSLLLSSGCGLMRTCYREIADLQIVQTVGFDSVPEGVSLSVASDTAPEGKGPARLSAGGGSVLSAMEALQAWSYSGEIYYPHTKYVLLGPGAAEDAEMFLDHLARSVQIRMDTPLFIVRGGEAGTLVTSAGGEEGDITEILASLERGLRRSGELPVTTCAQTALSLARSGAALFTCVRLSPNQGAGKGETALADGCAVIRDGELCGYIEGRAARGAALLRGELGDAAVLLPCGATVRLYGCEAETRPLWDASGALTGLEAALDISAELMELSTPLDPTDPETAAAIERELSETCAGWAVYVLSSSRSLGADFMELGRSIEVRYPRRWAALSEDWETALRGLSFTVTASSTLLRSGDILAPAGVKGGAS